MCTLLSVVRRLLYQTIQTFKNAGALPILRSARDDPDEENTLATALFELDLDEGSVQLQIFDREHPLPVRTLSVLKNQLADKED